MSSAQLDILPSADAALAVTSDPAPGGLRQQAAERLAAHRLRRARHTHGHAQAALDIELPPARTNKIAAAVAERYAQSPTYRAFLAQEAQRAIEKATAAAEIAARNAEAVTSAQQSLLAELELWVAPQEFSPATAVTHEPRPAAVSRSPKLALRADTSLFATAEAPAPAPPAREEPAGLVVHLYENVSRTPHPAPGHTLARGGSASSFQVADDPEESLALDEEIAFRQTPVFENYRDPFGPMDPIAANLVEFPRQLIATKKARPRIAEGPLRDESPRTPQLRIFEVETEQIATTPEPITTSPEWSNIRLEAHTLIEQLPDHPDEALAPSLTTPHTAAMSLRLMAASVDAILVLAAFVAFAATAGSIAKQLPTGPDALKEAARVAAATITIFYFLYQALFFTLSDQTPGMRLARIGLCTMSDENPSRSAMRRRILAQLIAACPLGIGIFWVFLDDDKLGWHDRISRMYQRAY